VVSAVFALTILSGAAVTVFGGFGIKFVFRCAGHFALIAVILITLMGTVPINQAALTWKPDAPPESWRALVNRWERLDTARTSAANAAFALSLAAIRAKKCRCHRKKMATAAGIWNKWGISRRITNESST
jgi:uncharacterized membrane protein